MESVELSHVYIYDGFVQHLISRSQFLESLILVNVSDQLGNICKNQSLKILKLRNCCGIKEIDAPNFGSFEYEGRCQIPELKLARESTHPKHSKIILSYDNNVNAAWFGNLRKFYQSRPLGHNFPFISPAEVLSTFIIGNCTT
ncbi:hypothetical protein P3L10_011201 [Capsicum annuum]